MEACLTSIMMVIPTGEINSNSPYFNNDYRYEFSVYPDGNTYSNHDVYRDSCGIKLKIIFLPYKLVTWKRLHVTLYFIMRTLGGTIMDEFLLHEGYQKLGASILTLVGFYSSVTNIVNTKYRNRYVEKRHSYNDLEKIDITPLASDLELRVFLSKENPTSFEYLNSAKEIAHTFIDACDDKDLIAYGISKAAATRLDGLITNKYAILAMYESNRTNSFGAKYRDIVEKRYKKNHAKSVDMDYIKMSSSDLSFDHFVDCFNSIVENDFTSISDGYIALSTDELFKALDAHRGDKLNTMKDIVNWAFTEEVNRFNDDFNKIILSIIS